MPSCAVELSQYWDGARLLLDPGAQSLQSVSLFGTEDTNAVQTVNAVVKHFRRDGSEQRSLSDDISGDNRVERPADARLLLRADIEDSSGTVVHSAIQCDSAEDDDLFETEMCQYDLLLGTVSTRALSVYFASPALQFARRHLRTSDWRKHHVQPARAAGRRAIADESQPVVSGW